MSWGLWNERTEKDLRVSWTAKKTNEWVLNKAGVKRELLDTAKARELAYYGHTMRKQGNCLEKEIMQETMPCARRRGRPRTGWINNTKSWTGLSVEESVWMTEDRDNGERTSMVWPTLGSRIKLRNRTEQNRTVQQGSLYQNAKFCPILTTRIRDICCRSSSISLTAWPTTKPNTIRIPCGDKKQKRWVFWTII